MHNLTISPIRAFSDNYIWLLVKGNQGVVVDPGRGTARYGSPAGPRDTVGRHPRDASSL